MTDVELLRMYVGDPDKVIWGDVELERLIQRAIEQYSADSLLFSGDAVFDVSDDGIGNLPDDFIGFDCGWNGDGGHVSVQSPNTVADTYGGWTTARGAQSAIVDVGESLYRLVPNPCDIRNRFAVTSEDRNGLLKFSSDEPAIGFFGVTVDGGYGLDVFLSVGEDIGSMHYRRVARREEILDEIALVVYAAHLAYLADTDLADANIAEFFRAIYESRVSKMTKVRVQNHGGIRRGTFF